MKKSLIPILAVIFLLSGCPSSAYHKMIVAEHDFDKTVSGFQNAEIAEFNAGNVPADIHNKLEQGTITVAQGGKQLATLLQQNASTQSITTELNLINVTLQNLLNDGVLQVKNAQTKANLQIALQSIQAIVTNVQTFVTN